MSAQLVRADEGQLLTADDFARAEDALDGMRADGNIETLHGVSVEAAIAREYHERNQHKEQADGFARLKVLAEAAIGRLDYEAVPRRSGPGNGRRDQLVIAGTAISSRTRNMWRNLGVGDVRGLLRPLLDEMAVDPDSEIGTSAASNRLEHMGIMWVPSAQLVKAAKTKGVSLNTASKQAEVHRPGRRAVNYAAAARIAEVLDINPRQLHLAPLRWSAGTRKEVRDRHARAVRALRAQEAARSARKVGGTIEEALSRLRKCAAIMEPAAQDCTTRDAQVAMRAAYAHLREAEDEVMRAIGIEYGS